MREIWAQSSSFRLKPPGQMQEEVYPLSPSNLLPLLYLWKRGYPEFHGMTPDRTALVWKLLPQRYFLTRGEFSWEVSSFYEVFAEECYKIDLKLKRVIDIGAYNGDTSVYFALQGAEVVALEPDPFHETIGLRNTELAGCQGQVQWIAGAWAPQKEQILFYPPPPPIRSPFLVQGYRLEDILSEVGWSSVSLTKVACEGCEALLFPHLSDELLRASQAWMIRLEKKCRIIEEKLSKSGFEIHQRSVYGAVLIIAIQK
ncbi:MAG: FkbM family methyltransferase [Bacteroidia bacterium]|nr:FkbM family methyltransferase [Bacteroidia bacterium]MDW8014514.1 FkbM family methyltransferase [Bacteroidia bacterium]